MGCFQSKKDSGDIHPNVFRVVNIDENGADLWSGQLEITETDLVLYREGRDATTWPLASLRRYGFDGEIFSFESGRRCATGEGIYAFRCRRAGMLFHTLQQNIQLRNDIQESLPFQIPPNLLLGGPPTLPRQTLQASVVHRSSVDNGQPVRQASSNNNLSNHMQMHTGIPRNVTQSPRSPSSSDILEVTPLHPRTQNSANHITNVYQVNDFKSKEHNNNQGEPNPETAGKHLYSNDINRDLAALRNSLHKKTALNSRREIEDETHFLRSRYINENILSNKTNAPLSPTHSNASEHYAQLSQEQQEAARLYVNIVPNEFNAADFNRNEIIPSTPRTPKQPEYCNLEMNTKYEMNSYANLSLGEMIESVSNTKQMLLSKISTDYPHKLSESDTYSMSPVEELEVNYAVLDIDSTKDNTKILVRDITSPECQSAASSRHESTTSQCSTQTRGRHMSQNSLEKASIVATPPVAITTNIGYTTIDFDKTVALTSVAGGVDVDVDGSRKTRHNSITTNSAGNNDRHRVN